VRGLFFLVMVLLMWSTVLPSIRAWVVAFWVIVVALYKGLLAIFGVE
jgi:hypothetical protein